MFCCRRIQAPPKTRKEDDKRIGTLLQTQPFVVSHYPSCHPLFDEFVQEIKDKSAELSEVHCSAELSSEYISLTADVCDIVSILTLPSNTIGAFGHSQIGDSGIFQLETLCAIPGKGYGSALLTDIETMAAKLDGFRRIELVPLRASEGFYEKMGYTRTQNYFVKVPKSKAGATTARYRLRPRRAHPRKQRRTRRQRRTQSSRGGYTEGQATAAASNI